MRNREGLSSAIACSCCFTGTIPKKEKKRGAKLLLQLRGIRVAIHASAVLPRVISRASGNSHVFALSVIFYGISTWDFRFGGFCLYFFFETNACARTWKLILSIICGILLLAFCRLYVFPKNIACCLNYSNQMLSNIKLILGCLCPVSQPQRLSAEQMDSIN